MNRKVITKSSPQDMSSYSNLFLHGLYLGLYGLVKYLPFPFFNYFRYAILRLFSGNIRSAYIMDGVTIWFPWRVSIGRRSSLNQGSIVDGFGGVRIGEGVRIAAYSCLNTTDHDFSNPDEYIVDQGFVSAPIVIEDDVWIGAGVNVNKGVTIAKGAVIGSGSVVTHDIPPYSIAAGVPCKVIGSRKNGKT